MCEIPPVSGLAAAELVALRGRRADAQLVRHCEQVEAGPEHPAAVRLTAW